MAKMAKMARMAKMAKMAKMVKTTCSTVNIMTNKPKYSMYLIPNNVDNCGNKIHKIVEKKLEIIHYY